MCILQNALDQSARERGLFKTPVPIQESAPPPVLRSSPGSGDSSNLSIRRGVSTQRKSRASGRSASKSKRFSTR
jgi:hypothetical protein